MIVEQKHNVRDSIIFILFRHLELTHSVVIEEKVKLNI